MKPTQTPTRAPQARRYEVDHDSTTLRQRRPASVLRRGLGDVTPPWQRPTFASPIPVKTPQPEPVEVESRRPTHEEISRRAHEIFLARGGGGDPESDWYQAERELVIQYDLGLR